MSIRPVMGSEYDVPYVHNLIDEIERLRNGLLSLKGEETVTLPDAPDFSATRIVSYTVLNERINKILGEKR